MTEDWHDVGCALIMSVCVRWPKRNVGMDSNDGCLEMVVACTMNRRTLDLERSVVFVADKLGGNGTGTTYALQLACDCWHGELIEPLWWMINLLFFLKKRCDSVIICARAIGWWWEWHIWKYVDVLRWKAIEWTAICSDRGQMYITWASRVSRWVRTHIPTTCQWRAVRQAGKLLFFSKCGWVASDLCSLLSQSDIRKITLCPGQLWRSFRGIRLGLKVW